MAPPDCNVKSYDAPLASFGKELPGNIAQQLQANPNANAMALQVGDSAVGLDSALSGAGISDPPPTITQGQTPTILKSLKDGGALKAIYGQELAETMWRAVDMLGRHFAEQSLEPNIKADAAAEWILTAENIPSTGKFPLVEDYKAQYSALWGVE